MLKAETEMFDKFDLQSLIKSNQMSVLSMSLCVFDPTEFPTNRGVCPET